jgi:hypothetical protein
MSNQEASSKPEVDPAVGRLVLIVAASALGLALILKFAGLSAPLFFVLMLLFWALLLYVGTDVLGFIALGIVVLCAVAGGAAAGGDDAIVGAIIGALIPIAIVFLVSVAVILGPPFLAGYAVHEAMGGGCVATGLAVITFGVVLAIVYAIAVFLIGFAYAAITGELALAAAAFITGIIDTGYLASSISRGDPGRAIDALLDMLQAHGYMEIGHVLVIIGAVVYGIICVALFLRGGAEERPLSLSQVLSSLRARREQEAVPSAQSPQGAQSAPSSGRPRPESPGDQLRALEEARRAGRVSEAEYRRERERIIRLL